MESFDYLSLGGLKHLLPLGDSYMEGLNHLFLSLSLGIFESNLS